MECSDCGSEVETTASACPRCGLQDSPLKPETGAVGITEYPPGYAVESPIDTDGPRRVEYCPSTGGKSVSKTDAAGSFDIAVSSPLQVGRAGEPHVITTLINALRASGETAHQLTGDSDGARDDRGEDGLVEINGRRLLVQVETVPRDESLWREWSKGCASRVEGAGGSRGSCASGHWAQVSPRAGCAAVDPLGA
jgi:hypothetical protein